MKGTDVEHKLLNVLKDNLSQILLVFIAFLIMVVVSYSYVSNIVREQMREIGEEVMNTTQTTVTGNLSETELIFTNTLQNVESMLLEGMSNSEILEALKEANRYFGDDRSPLPDFLKTYGYIRGEFLDGSGWIPPDDYDPAQRVWYIGAVENPNTVYFSEPYVDADTGGMCITFSQEIFDEDGTSFGVVAIDLNLSRITDYLDEQHISNEGYGILLSNQMQVTTHKEADFIGEQFGSINVDYQYLENMLLAGGEVSAQRFTDYDGTDSVAYFRKIFNGWYIGIFTPRANFYADAYRMGVVLAILGTILMAGLSALLVRSRMDKLRADEESRSKSNFLARMSHEMRTPMNAIIGMSKIAKDTADMEKIQECLYKIQLSADHLLGVINDVLDMSKIEAGKLELSPTVFELEKLLHNINGVMEFRIADKKQQYNLHLDPDVPAYIIADEQRLSQVLANLLSNANKFTPDGGSIELHISCSECDNDSCTLNVYVKDTGIGLSEEQKGRLFNTFEQADNNISRKFGGSGLGLAITKSLVEKMGGRIWIESELGKGSIFAFTIKVGISDSIEEESFEISENTEEIFKGFRILLAEDIDINREILISMLENTGIIIDEAEDGIRAVELFKENHDSYDLIFMDIHMPGMDGYDATAKIRSLDISHAQEIPIIAMTADVFREDIERAKKAGMNGHLGKPINIDEVIHTIQSYVTK